MAIIVICIIIFIISVAIGAYQTNKKEKQKTIQPASPAPVPPTPAYKWESHHVAGITQYTDNVMALAIEDGDYDYSKKELVENFLTDERVYQYYFNIATVELVPEPDNEHDPNAIKVIFDGQHIGYIKKGSCSHIKKLMKESKIQKINGELAGGKYKYVHEVDDNKYEMEKDEAPYFATVKIATLEEGGQP